MESPLAIIVGLAVFGLALVLLGAGFYNGYKKGRADAMKEMDRRLQRLMENE